MVFGNWDYRSVGVTHLVEQQCRHPDSDVQAERSREDDADYKFTSPSSTVRYPSFDSRSYHRLASPSPTTSTSTASPPPVAPSSINSANICLFTAIHLFAMSNIPTFLQALLAASSIFSLLPLALLLVLTILTTLFFVVAFRLIPSSREVAELSDKNATLQREFDACKKALDALIEESDRTPVPNAKTSHDAKEPSPQSSPLAPAVDVEVESERVQALEARLDFIRDSCKIMMAQKNDLLAQKDGLLSQQNGDLAALKAQLAAAHQTKDELLAEKDASCRTILAQKTDELATLKAHIAAAHQTLATTITERDEAVARAHTIADGLEQTRADYDDKIASLTTRIVDAETSAASLQTLAQQRESKISDILLKNNNLNVEIVLLTKRLEATTRQRTTPSSPRYSFQSIISPRSSESESDSSFDSDRPSPSRWRRFTIRRTRKSGKP